MELFDAFLLGFVAGFFAAYMVGRALVRHAIEQLQDELPAEDETIRTKVEQENGVFFVYNIADGQFVAQGRTLAEIKAQVKERFKGINKDIKIVDGDVDVIKALLAEQLKSTT